MKEVKRRKAHLPEFKAKVGLEALRGEKTVNQIGQEYGVNPVRVGQWKKEIQALAKTMFEGRRGPKPIAAHQEPELLYSQIGKLKVELDWLKKSPGSACHNQTKMDWSKRGVGESGGGGSQGSGERSPSMRAGRSITRHGLC